MQIPSKMEKSGMEISINFSKPHLLRMQQNTWNVVQLGVSFFLIFFAFNSVASILEFLLDGFGGDRVERHAGYQSLSIIYGIFSVANLISAPIVHKLGTRYTMTLGAAAYCIFSAGFFFINSPYLIISSILVGLGASVLWSAEGNYLSQNSNTFSASKHSAIFWGILQSSQICAGMFLFAVFHFHNKIDFSTIYLIFGVFTFTSLIGALMLMSLRGSESGSLQYAPKMNTIMVASKPQYNHLEMMKSTIELFVSRRMLLFIFVFLFSGMEQSFNGPIYSTCIAFTLKFDSNNGQLVAMNFIVQGLGQITGSVIFGFFNRKFGHSGRDKIVFVVTVAHLLSYLAVYINFPSNSSLEKTQNIGYISPQIWLAMICGYIFGVSDACWNTQITSFLITQFQDKNAEAFSLFKIFQTLASCSIFFLSTSLQLNEHLILLSVGATIACLCFIMAEHFVRDDNSNFYRENRAQINYIHALAYRQQKLSKSGTFPSTQSSSWATAINEQIRDRY